MKLYLGTNTKMYKTIEDTKQYLRRLHELTMDIQNDDIQLFVIPSFTSLESAKKQLDKSSIFLGAQNMCWEDKGQFTGEISPLMLKEIGINVIEIGHSERRHIFGETNEDERKKVETAIKHGFTALLCIGETADDKEYNIGDEVLTIQIKTALKNISKTQLTNIWIAYEPVWAIGVNGIPASPNYVEKKHSYIRNILIEMYGDAGNNIPLLYGGSVNNNNAKELIPLNNIDGLFIGRSAWDPNNFNEIIRSIKKVLTIKAKKL